MGKFFGSNLSLDHIFWVVMHRGKSLIMDGSCKGGQLHWWAAALVGSSKYWAAGMVNHLQLPHPLKF
jgi:hypothetical protein